MKRLSICLTAALIGGSVLLSPTAKADVSRLPDPGRTAVASTEGSLLDALRSGRVTEPFGSKLEGSQVIEFDPLNVVETPVVKQSRKGVIARSAEQPVGKLYMVSAIQVGGNTGSFRSLDAGTGVNTAIYTGNYYTLGSEDYQFQCGVVRGDMLYIPTYYEDMIEGTVDVNWRKLNLDNGKYEGLVPFGTDRSRCLNAFMYAMTYDSYRDCIWGLAYDLTGSNVGGRLIKVDTSKPETGSWLTGWAPEYTGIQIGSTTGDYMMNLAYCPIDNCLYGIKDNGVMVCVDPDKGTITTVCEFDEQNDYYCFGDPQYNLPLIYSPRDRAFFGVYPDRGDVGGQSAMVVFGIDYDTFASYELSTLSPLCWTASLHCFDSYAEDGNPDRVSDLSVEFDKASLNGTVKFTMPTTTFGGIALDRNTALMASVYVDGKEVFTNSYTAGEAVSEPIRVKEGYHEVKVVPFITESKPGAELVKRFYAGNDIPYAANNVRLDDLTLSWTAPQPGGIHGGYVDREDLGYNIYDVNARTGAIRSKLNDTPVKATSFTVPVPRTLTRYNLVVKAVAHDVESEGTSYITHVFGPGLATPVELTVTPDQFDLFDSVDSNRDGETFGLDSRENLVYIRSPFGYEYPDDYLFLPKVALNNTNVQYNISFDYRNYYQNEKHRNAIEIRLLKKFSTASSDVVRVIYAAEGLANPSWTTVNARFAVAEPGEYYIAIHEYTPDVRVKAPYRGAAYRNIKIEELNVSTKAPADPQNVKLSAHANGAKMADITFTAPALDMAGNALEDENVTVTATCGSNTASTTVKAGAEGKIELDVEDNGTQRITLTPSNKFGEGAPVLHAAYIGLDTPKAPQNIKAVISDDNLSMNITWDAPDAEGINGGYVDPEGVRYNMYTASTISTTKIEGAQGISQREYTFRVNPGYQAFYNVGPTAVNEMGESTGSVFVHESLGTPYTVPMIEEFPTSVTSFNLRRWTYDASSPIIWQSCSDMNGYIPGNPTFEGGGGMYAVAQMGLGTGTLYGPRFTTVGVPAASFVTKYWEYAKGADMELWIRTCKDQTPRLLASKTMPMRPGTRWQTWKVELPEDALNCGWVQIDLKAIVDSDDSYCLIDNFTVQQDVDHDFAISSITGQYNLFVGETLDATLNIANSGQDAARGNVKVELIGDGEVLQTQNIATDRLTPSTIFTTVVSFDMKVEYLQKSKMLVRATVTNEDDQVAFNNVKELEFLLSDNTLPHADNLKAEWIGGDAGEHKEVALTWDAPSRVAKADIQSWEAIKPFGLPDEISGWKNYDLDKTHPFALTLNNVDPIKWEDYDKPCAWQVIDVKESGLDQNERYKARTGTKYIMARATPDSENNDGSTFLAASDWLVSPLISPDAEYLTFWMNTLGSEYTETISIYYSTTDTEFDPDFVMPNNKVPTMPANGSFKFGRNFTKSGQEAWEECTWKLPEGTKYIALVYRSIGQFGAMVDDLELKLAEPQEWEVLSYKVEREEFGESKTIAEGLKTLSYTDTENDNIGDATYYVRPTVKSGTTTFDGPRSIGAKVIATAVEGIDSDNVFVGGGKSIIFFGGLQGKTVKVFTADGKLVNSVLVNADRMSVAATAGVYVVTVDNKSWKIIVR